MSGLRDVKEEDLHEQISNSSNIESLNWEENRLNQELHTPRFDCK